jgi:hypothetical protein
VFVEGIGIMGREDIEEKRELFTPPIEYEGLGGNIT